jgi:ABC-type iron transport system FetAB ATPase subunit
VAAGECVAVVGPSGSGKSVLLRMIADLDPNSGEVLLDGRPRESWSGPAWRRMVIYQAAEAAWWEPTAEAHFSRAEMESVRALLRQLLLKEEVLDADIGRLSTGERQRLALIRSLVRRPAVLLLDEPTSALDQASIAAVEARLQAGLEEGMAMVLVTHSQEQAGRIAGRIMTIRNGMLEAA